MSMKKQFLAPILFLSMVSSITQLNAQVKLLKGIRDNMMDDQNKDVALAKYEIDKVMLHPETKDMCAAWAWKGLVYSDIAMSGDSSIYKLDENHNAAELSAEAFLKFYSCSEEEQEKIDAKTAADAYLVNSISACWNKAVYVSREPGKYYEVKKLMGYVERLLVYDKEEKAKTNNVTREQAIYAVWRAAYIDTLVDEEIVSLEKLIAVPNYMNYVVFIRMAEIYSAKKQYEKALEYLEKGKAKIPQKSSDFLDMQINIEIERENMVALLTKFNEAIESNPENPVYYFSRGVAYHKLKTDEIKNQDLAYKNKTNIPASKYSFAQGLNDYRKALEFDNGFVNASKNEAILFFDSANYIYRMRARVSANEYEKYNTLSSSLYNQALQMFERLRESGALKDQDLIDALKDMIMICNKISDKEHMDLKIKYEGFLKSEKRKQEATSK
jgi:tetratricopeptide (TPR) repeat protein